ncbi:TPA: DUF551 domain-containing protein [Klebsiella pneumoniae]|nr:DUF551 domain-containing protein [Klebsiella pneumoniae]
MTKSTITRERLEQLANFKGAPVTRQEEQELARMALAAMDSEPVAYIDKQWTLVYYVPPMSMGLKIGDKLYRHAQPAPVVLDGYVMVPKEATLEMIKSGASAASNGMLIPGIYKAMLAAADCSIPMISDRWIPVSEQMPEVGDIVLTAMGGAVNVGEMECSAANCRFFTSVISGRELPATHWMPLPAGPKEDINALIPLVSRNEQEGK